MFDVIIPTIWAPELETIDKLIISLNNCGIIGNVILINNNPDKFSKRYKDLFKVKEYQFDNIYVNQAWNFGVSKSSSEFVSLINDDIIFNTDIFYFLKRSLEKEEVKIIGACKTCYTLDNDQSFEIEKITIRNRGWGCFISFMKSNYQPIPEDLLIHFGDDYLIKKLENGVYKLKGLKINSVISTSINHDSKFEEIIKQDNINSLKYELPWSNDY